ncbi:MAG TPA: D-aminoacylase [Chloroflexota bacterium]
MAEYDLAIRGGRLVDGTGNPWYWGDVAVKDGRIAAIGAVGPNAAARTIEADGRVVCPGFIDMHTHSDIPLLKDGDAQSKVRQGVTLDVLGESVTVAPLIGPEGEEFRRDQRHRFGLDDVDWTDFAGYFARLQRQGIAMNIVSGVSPQQVKRCIVGFDNRPASPEELRAMERLTIEAMEQGAVCLTCAWHGGGPEFPDEVVALAKVVQRAGGYYGVHLGTEGDEMVEELEKALYVGREARIPVHIYHIKARGRQNWGRVEQAIELIEAARAEGLEVTANQYPYTAMQHPWARLMPRWVQDAPRQETMPRFGERAFRDRVKQDPEFQQYVAEHGGWDGIVASVLRNPALEPYQGKRAVQIAAMRGREDDPAEAVFDLVFEEGAFPHGVYHNMSEDDVKALMRRPWVSVASDGTALNLEAPGFPHPRSFGTNPRVLGKYVREESVLHLEEAVRKMTSLPAQVLRLRDRGLLREGYWADLVVFDPDRVADRATFEQPKQYPVGVDHVLVNGTPVVDAGDHTGARPGRVLYGSGKR